MTRSGRRAGDGDTREQILDAARTAFAEDGYGATIRQIATAAAVDPALVMHYFGNKERLYLSSIHIAIDPEMLQQALRTGPREDLGTRLTQMFFSVWEVSETREPLLAILRGAIAGHDPGMDAFRGFVSSSLLPIVAGGIEDDERQLLAELAVAQLVGIAVMRYVAKLEPIASAPIDDVVRMVSPRIQAYFT
jgi:AcrR family transcriptional regulator